MTLDIFSFSRTMRALWRPRHSSHSKACKNPRLVFLTTFPALTGTALRSPINAVRGGGVQNAEATSRSSSLRALLVWQGRGSARSAALIRTSSEFSALVPCNCRRHESGRKDSDPLSSSRCTSPSCHIRLAYPRSRTSTMPDIVRMQLDIFRTPYRGTRHA